MIHLWEVKGILGGIKQVVRLFMIIAVQEVLYVVMIRKSVSYWMETNNSFSCM